VISQQHQHKEKISTDAIDKLSANAIDKLLIVMLFLLLIVSRTPIDLSGFL